MVRIVILVIFSIWFSVGLRAQTISETKVIQWNRCDESNPLLSFSNQSGVTTEELPLLMVRYPLPSNNLTLQDIKVKLNVLEQNATNAVETALIKKMDVNAITYSETHIVTIRKKNYLEIQMVPIVFNEDLKVYNKINCIQIQVDTIKTSYSTALTTINNSSVAEHSVLSSGRWIKIGITESGIHKIPYSLLSSWGFSDGANVKVFGNGGNMLPKSNGMSRIDDLAENAVMHANNAIYFYAQGPTEWTYNTQRDMFVQQINDYSDEAYYFLTEDVGEGREVQVSTDAYDTYNVETNEYDSYDYYEAEMYNIIKSGRTWYGDRIEVGTPVDFEFNFPNLVKDQPVKLLTNVIGRSSSVSYMNIFVNGSEQALHSISIPSVTYGTTTGNAAQKGIADASFYSNSNTIQVGLEYRSNSGGAYSYLNYLCINAKESLILNDELAFRNKDVIGNSNVVRYYIDNTNNNSILWNITNHTSPVSINLEDYGNKRGFTAEARYLKEYIVFNPSANFPQPTFLEEVSNQDLHGATVPEMLIVANPIFKDQAERLAALHLEHSGLQCLVVEPELVYNEFSSGQPDVCALRDYARFLYEKQDGFKYLLLFGNGSYDNRSIDSDNTNFILTYQSENSINFSNSYVSDDFYGFLDLNEGENIQTNKLDIGIGRFPVNNTMEAKAVVDKIENYLFGSDYSNWKGTLTFVGDDGDSNLHMWQADSLTRMVNTSNPEFDINKIYLDAYVKETNTAGDRYPDAHDAIMDAIGNGTLIFNYTGHGSENQLAHENILNRTDIQGLTNANKLPLFVTATCEFSRFDDKTLRDGSAGEAVLISPNGGGIGLLTTTRVAWSNSNFSLNKTLYENIFQQGEYGEIPRLGDIICKTKNAISNTINKLNFTLLGDPALQLAYPSNNILIEKLNGETNPEKQDTLKALDLVNIEGLVDGEQTDIFKSGTVNVRVFDKPVTATTQGNTGNVPFGYEVFESRIFNGDVDVKDGRFTVSFMVPKDIKYNVDNGRVSFYGSDTDLNEAFGASNTIKVGSMTNNPPDDNEGPEIVAWLNDESFENGDITGSSPILEANFFDESGINASGVGIGHDITLTIDDNRANSIILNDYYSSVNNTYKKGSLSYQLPALEKGDHVLQLKAWDNVNNSSTIELSFKVEISGELKISNSMLYPNPIRSSETVFISFEHDSPNSTLNTTLRLYDLSGRRIDEVSQQVPSVGIAVTAFQYQIPSVVRRGMYILKSDFSTNEGQQGSFSKKILVIE
nr:type IX secretion system sortase PorU [uncultured Carboxylicivirga sp.]